ncbi:MAG: stage II sporulation protein E [Deltaproteobacteria bacterium]|nr:stage II sporulation protein E [Deltaproteobacteria bacterium]TLN04208.1 MAG: stage II sporulation protein E [bacterium]
MPPEASSLPATAQATSNDEQSGDGAGTGTPLAESRDFVPCLRDIMQEAHDIHPDRKVREVVDVFQADTTLLLLPLVAEGVFAGAVSRKNLFFTHLSRKFALDLYSNKPIAELKDDNPIVMDPELDIAAALAILIDRDPILENDCLLIAEGERCVGVVLVSDLMMRISEFQQSLLATLRSLSERIRNEVAHASLIQQDLLPEPKFSFRDIRIGAGITTSTEIGGDFYDYFVCGENRLGLIIADVSGHGVQSGMVTTAAKASLHTLLSLGVATPTELLSGMNRAITATARRRLLMTCFVAVIDTENKRLSYANAGHNFPYLVRGRSGSLEMLEEASGFPLGFEEDSFYQEFSLEFLQGDSVVLYTDGIVECRGPDEEEFGYKRLENLLRENLGKGPHEAALAMLERVREYSGTSSLEDDATVMIAVLAP